MTHIHVHVSVTGFSCAFKRILLNSEFRDLLDQLSAVRQMIPTIIFSP